MTSDVSTSVERCAGNWNWRPRASGSAPTASAASPRARSRGFSPAATTGSWLRPCRPPWAARCWSREWRRSTRVPAASADHLGRQPLGRRHRRTPGASTPSSASTWTCPPRCGPTPLADALLEKRVWMEPGATRPTCAYRLARAAAPVALEVAGARQLPGLSRHDPRARGWSMVVEPLPAGVRVTAFEGARPFAVWRRAPQPSRATTWYYAVRPGPRARARARLPWTTTLHAVTFRLVLGAGRDTTFVLLRRGGAGDRMRTAPGRARRARAAARVGAWRDAQPAAPPEPGLGGAPRARRRPVPRRPTGSPTARWDVGHRRLSVVRRTGVATR